MSTYKCCYKCEDRHPLCHSDCERYLEFVKKNEERKRRMHKDDVFKGYRQESMDRLNKVKARHRIKRSGY